MTKTLRSSDLLDPARARAFAATFPLGYRAAIATPRAGDPLPVFLHQLYFWEPAPTDELGRDGHQRVGGFIPDLGLPRRMWAGGELEFRSPLILGTPAHKVSIVQRAERKMGRSGPLGFVRLRNEISQGDRVSLVEYQDLVYREEAQAGAAREAKAEPAPRDEVDRWRHNFGPTELFRY